MTQRRNVDSLLRLLAWMSPAFPVGAFSYSGGLESAVADRRVTNAAGLSDWIALSLQRGALWNDAVMLSEAWNGFADDVVLNEIAELSRALAGSAERYRETVLLGDAFVDAARAWPSPVFDRLPVSPTYPVAVGAVAAAHEIALEDVLAAYLHSGLSQLISAGIRLGVAGQKDGVAILARLEEAVAEVAARASTATLDDLGSATIIADTAPMRHEVQGTRLFRS
ncbi:urease accessory protein UreF [Agrobacterium larrymoorei]|uniref:Urease accessory protein UreF n=1 Tax=Agrobacterium larrymoorei TaxID=160699 RepID=A0AAJ2EW07_9HYPH|nr:urease accessory protein UreF [Agrobacterium larrymoorei]MDQ1186779.1 urease accessory protein [Agrobacterium larrymoorei]MDR6103062.1 urease accessory protein [Agrobacterium larrymoorei]